MRELVIRFLAVSSFIWVMLYVLALDSLSNKQLLIGAMTCVIPVLYLAAFLYANYH